MRAIPPRPRRRRYLWLLLPLVLMVLPFALYGWAEGAIWPDADASKLSDAERAALAVPGNAVSFSPSLETIVDADSAKTLDDRPPPPSRLDAQLKALGAGFDGDVGISVQSVEKGWVASHDALRPYPQQSVSKLWVAMALLDKVDSGEVLLTDPITLTQADLTIFHQPIRKRIGNGSYDTSLSELLILAMTRSDNTANHALFLKAGGQAGVQDFLAGKGLDGIRVSPGEKTLQMQIAGMQWDDRYATGRSFWVARDKIPMRARAASLGAYLADPLDGARPAAISDALVRLQRGELLSAQSTALLIELMTQSKTGPKRLRGGLDGGAAQGWILPHKTGTGQDLEKLSTAYNDVGLLVSPKGNHYAVAVMIGATNRPVPERQALMQSVTRAVIQCESQGWAGC